MARQLRYFRRGAVVAFATTAVASACADSSTEEEETRDASVDVGMPDASAAETSSSGDANVELDGAVGPLPEDAEAPIEDAAMVEDAAMIEDAAAADATPADAGLACHGLTQVGAPVEAIDRVGFLPSSVLRGGTIVDGDYVLTSVTVYVEPSHQDGTLSPYGAETIRIHGGKLDSVFVHASGEAVRFEASLVLTGTRIAMTTSCVWNTPIGSYLPVLWDWAPLVHDECTYEATPSTLTVWVPQGNHAQVVRVYTKL